MISTSVASGEEAIYQCVAVGGFVSQKQALDYSPREKPPSRAGVLSTAIGIVTGTLSIACLIALGGYGPIESVVLRLAFDYHLGLLLPLFALVGVGTGIAGGRTARGPWTATGIVLSGIALLVALAVCAVSAQMAWFPFG